MIPDEARREEDLMSGLWGRTVDLASERLDKTAAANSRISSSSTVMAPTMDDRGIKRGHVTKEVIGEKDLLAVLIFYELSWHSVDLALVRQIG